jgi:hypothetical protein
MARIPDILRRERSLCGLALGAAVLGILAGDGYLLQRVDEYFGGTKIMRPLALKRPAEYLLFLAQSLLYSVCFYGTSGALLLAAAKRLLRCNPLQALHLALSLLGTVVVVFWLTSWQVYSYFRTSFDLAIFRQLTVGRFANALFYVSPEQFLGLGLGLLLLIANVAIIRRLRSLDGALEPWTPGRRFWIAVAALWALVVVNHFAIRSHEALRFGLRKQIAHWVTDSVLQEVTDFDRDGFGPLSVPRDPDNFDSRIHRHAVDHPGNGLDEDGLFGDLAIGRDGAKHPTPAPPEPMPAARPRRNVIVVVVETFRTGVIGSRLDGEPVTPFLDSIAREHAHTELLYSNYGITSFAIQTTFFGSLYYHGRHPHLFDLLREQGYRTFVVSAQNENWGDTYELLGMDRVDRFWDARFFDDWEGEDLTPIQKMNPINATVGWEVVNRQVFETLDAPRDAPFLLYVNYQDLHYPYWSRRMERRFIREPRTDTAFFRRENRPAVLRQYANAAHHLDEAFADLFRGLEERGLLDSSVIVILGDHPDSFYENDRFGHAWTVDEHQRRTPLLVVNGRGEFPVPLGQDQIADVLLQSLCADADAPPLRFVEDHGKRVFVLSGWLGEPRQIAWIAPGDLLTFDFKTDRAQLREGGPWLSLSEAEKQPEGPELRELVAFWELNRWKNATRAERWTAPPALAGSRRHATVDRREP